VASGGIWCCRHRAGAANRRKDQFLTPQATSEALPLAGDPQEALDRDDLIAEETLKLVLASLEDSKAEDILSLDIARKSSLGDYMVIASGRSHRHVGAIADHLLRDLKDNGFGRVRAEGLQSCDWVLIDAGDVIVHVFRPEVRGFYNIEKMWAIDAEEPVETS